MRFALAILLATACRTAMPSANDADVLITLERQACYGVCPVYLFMVYDDGRFWYLGLQFVKVKDEVTGFLTLSQVKRIERAFDDARYFTLADSYDQSGYDADTVITSYRRGNDVKSIVHYRGDPGAPQVLTKLENEIDTIAQTDRWIGTAKEREELQQQWW